MTGGPGNESMMHPVDHLLYAAPDLDQGMDEIEALFGVRPVIGGRHPAFGTHNALLSLGPDVYLEVIASDPALPAPARGRLVDLEPAADSRLITWVLRVPDIEAAAAAATRKGVAIGDVQAGQRQTPDGDTVRWKLTDPWAERLQGALPFLIDWGDTPHPGGVAPAGGVFRSLVIEHPDPNAVHAALAVLGSDVDVRRAAAFGLVAAIESPKGLVELR